MLLHAVDVLREPVWNDVLTSDSSRFYPAQKGQEVTDVYGQNRPDIHTGIEANLDVQVR